MEKKEINEIPAAKDEKPEQSQPYVSHLRQFLKPGVEEELEVRKELLERLRLAKEKERPRVPFSTHYEGLRKDHQRHME